MRDARDNVVVVCSIENLDPMGVHTGDSVTVAPQMTLSDEAFQELRDAAARVIRAVGVETGGSNIQFARERESGELRVIEMNPRVSRSSALASKATGYPIAKVAAKLAVGYTLDEIPNDLTQTTPASFEPTLDYVVVKFPRFAFEKFPGADEELGTQMKSVGEAMGIGRTFTEAFLKAMRSRELDPGAPDAVGNARRLAGRGASRGSGNSSSAPGRRSPRPVGARISSRPTGSASSGSAGRTPTWPRPGARARRTCAAHAAPGACARPFGGSTRAPPRWRRARTTSTRPGARRTSRGRTGRRGASSFSARARTGSARASSSTTAASTPCRPSAPSATRRSWSTAIPRPSPPTTTRPTGSTSSRSGSRKCWRSARASSRRASSSSSAGRRRSSSPVRSSRRA